MEELGKRATSPGTVYLTGGSTALLLGFREQTVDIDIKLEPEPAGAFQATVDDLVRYPAVNAPDFLSKLEKFLSDETQARG